MQYKSSPGSTLRCRSSISSASAMFLRNSTVAIAFFLILVFSPYSYAQAPPVGATVTHIVAVGRRGDDLALRFTPEETFAAIGDLVQFQFYPLNHSAVSADFNRPCAPLSPDSGRAFFSGFQPLPPNAETLTSFTIPVTSLEPLFFYCAQERHCQQGFVGVINPNQQQTLAAFRAAAANAPDGVFPGRNPDQAPTFVPSPSRQPVLSTNRPPQATLNIPTIIRPSAISTSATNSPDSRTTTSRTTGPTTSTTPIPIAPGFGGGNDVINGIDNGEVDGGNPIQADGANGDSNGGNGGSSSPNSTNPVRNIGAMVGIVLGGAVFLALIVGGIVYWFMRRRKRKGSIFGGNASDFTQPLNQEKGLGGGAFDFKSKFKISGPSAPIEPTYITPEPDRGRTGFIPIGASAQPTPPRPAATRATQLPLKNPQRGPFNGSGGGEIKPLNLNTRRNNPSMPPPVSLERSTSRSTMASGRNPIDSYISALGFDDPNAPYIPPNGGGPGTRGYTVIAKGNPYDFTASNGSPTYTAAPGSPSSVYTYSFANDTRRPASPPPPVPRLDYGRPGQGR